MAEPKTFFGSGAPRRVEPMPVRRQVEDALRDAIVTGHYPPGTHLSDRALMETFGTSRQIIREAIRLLEAEGLVEQRPHRGPIVAMLTADEAEDVYAVRAQLEGLVVHEFARKAIESDRAALRAVFERLSRSGAADNKEALLAIKQQIYDVLLVGCGNSYASQMLTTILHRIRQLRAYSLSAPGGSSIRSKRCVQSSMRSNAGMLKAPPLRADCMCKKRPRLHFLFCGLRKQSKRGSPNGKGGPGLVPVLCRSPISLSHLGFGGERADAA